VPNCGWIAKSVTEKNNGRVDCAEVGKKTVQALHFDRLNELARKGEDFCLLGIASPSGAAPILLSGLPDRFIIKVITIFYF
jgi:hypothetical protein